MVITRSMGKQRGYIFCSDNPWDNCSYKGSETRRQPCVSRDFYFPVVLETSVCARLVSGLFYSFNQHGKFAALYLLYDQRSQDITQSSHSKNYLGDPDRRRFFLSSCVQMEIQHGHMDVSSLCAAGTLAGQDLQSRRFSMEKFLI